MRRSTARRALVSALLVVAGGCSSSLTLGPGAIADGGVGGDDGSGTSPVTDGATGGSPDGGVDGGGSPKLVVVHAAPGLPSFRLCFSAAPLGRVPSVLSVPALPDRALPAPAVPSIGPYPAVPVGTPGVAPGAIYALPDLGSFAKVAVTPFVVLATSVAGDSEDGGPDGGAEETCDALIGPHGLGVDDVPSAGRLVAGQDFWATTTLPAGTFADGATYLLSAIGCLAGTVPMPDGGVDAAGPADAAEAGAPVVQTACGPDYDGGDDLTVAVAALDLSAAPSSGLGVQFADRSSAFEALAATGGVVPYFVHAVDAGPDAAPAIVPVLAADAGPVFFGGSSVSPATASSVAIDSTDPSWSFGVVVAVPDGGTPRLSPYPQGDLVALPLSTIERLSAWTASTQSASPAFIAGQAYAFVLVGDPSQEPLTAPDDAGDPAPNPRYDGRGLHLVAFPTSFTPTSLAGP